MMKNSHHFTLRDVIEDLYHILIECERNDSFRFTTDQFSQVGGCNNILAFPLSGEAKMLCELVERSLKLR